MRRILFILILLLILIVVGVFWETSKDTVLEEAQERPGGELSYYRDGVWTSLDALMARQDWSQGDAPLAEVVRFDSVSVGVRAGTLRMQRKWGLPFRVVVLEIDPEQARMEILVNDGRIDSMAFVRDMAKQHGAVAAINAGFYNEEGALGLVLHAGDTLQAPNRSPGYFVIQDGRPKIFHDRNVDLRGAQEGIQCSPALMIDGKIFSYIREGDNIRKADPRSVVALTHTNKVLLAATNGTWLGGLTMQQLAAILGALGARDALALDGGGSTQLYVANRGLSVTGWDRVPVALGIFDQSAGR